MSDWTQYNRQFYEEPNSTLRQENDWLEGIIRQLAVDGTCCLDFGCGSGTWSALLLACGADVVGLDVSLAAIQRCRSLYPTGKFHLLQGAWPLDGESVDLIITTWTIQEIDRQEEFEHHLRELRRVLRSGGRFLVVNNVYPDARELLETTPLGDLFANEGDTPPRLRFFPNDTMVSLMTSLGFERQARSATGWSYCEVYGKV